MRNRPSGGCHSTRAEAGFGEKELPKRFDTDDYQVLVVAMPTLTHGGPGDDDFVDRIPRL